MYQKPKAAKRLYFDVIPRTVDDYLAFLDKFPQEDEASRLNNPVWHIHHGKPPQPETGLGYNILLNLASVCHAEDRSVLWQFISRYVPGATPSSAPILDRLVDCAVAYYKDFVKPNKRYRLASEAELAALRELSDALKDLAEDAGVDAIQTLVYEIGKRHAATFPDLKTWFQSLYEILLGQDQGPRMGSFIALYGVDETVALLKRALAGEDLAA
jgi:lysyl-tRNA synthetase, class I